MAIFFRRFGWKSLLALALLAGYTVRFIQFNAFKPQLKFNLMEEANAKIREYKPEECAWPVIQELSQANKLEPPRNGDWFRSWPPSRATDPGWKESVAFVTASPDTVVRLRGAAARPYLGYLLHVESGESNPFAFDLIIGHLGALRGAARFMKVHMAIAANQGDAEGVVADYDVCAHLCDYASEIPLSTCQLVSGGIAVMSFDAVSETLTDHPGLLSDKQLAQLIEITGKFGAGRFRPNVELEQRMSDDFLQRVFTDDGSGSGRPCFEGKHFIENLRRSITPPDAEWEIRCFGPLASIGDSTRKEVDAQLARMYKLAREDARSDPWTLNEFSLEKYLNSLPNSGVGGLILHATSLNAVLRPAVQVEGHRSGVLVGLALERYQLVHNAFPQSLTELVPQFISSVPTDPHSGTSVLYHLREGRPLVYSVGADRDDDGGRVPETPSDQGGVEMWTSRTAGKKVPDGDFVLFPPPELSKTPAKPN